MQLEQICTSQELSKQLAEAGYPQKESLFVWGVWGGGLVLHYVADEGKGEWEDEWFAAPTASEIGERLPKRLFYPKCKETHLDFLKVGPELKSGWLAVYVNQNFPSDERLEAHDEMLVNCLAKLWLEVKKQGLLDKE